MWPKREAPTLCTVETKKLRQKVEPQWVQPSKARPSDFHQSGSTSWGSHSLPRYGHVLGKQASEHTSTSRGIPMATVTDSKSACGKMVHAICHHRSWESPAHACQNVKSLNMHYYMKGGKPERLHTVWFQLYRILKKQKNQTLETVKRSVGSKNEKARRGKSKAWRTLREWEDLGYYYNSEYSSVHIGQNPHKASKTKSNPVTGSKAGGARPSRPLR